MKNIAFEGLTVRLARQMQQFAREERGSIGAVMVFFFFWMIVLGGIAVDVMRFETQRVAVQNTLDRAALAVANMNSALTTDEVHTTRQAKADYIVGDYFSKANLEKNLAYVRLDDGMNYRVVEARADVHSHNIFMNLIGIPTLDTMNTSIAEQRITDIEIMLVLDVSGSMAGAKIDNLRIAAADFIDQVKESDNENRISIGVIPYNAQVNLGQKLREQYNIRDLHGVAYSNCVELPIGSDANNIFQTLALSTSYEMPLMTAADTQSASSTDNTYFNWRDQSNASQSRLIGTAAARWCNPNTSTEITLPTKDAEAAKAGINALQASGNTSILLGMRWATALIDPSARGVYSALIADRSMDLEMYGRPFEYNDANTTDDDSLKVIVLMTDGEHVAHKRIANGYKTGEATISFSYRPNNSSSNVSDRATIWRSAGGEWSVFFASKVVNSNICGSRPFWVPSTGTWQNRPEGAPAARPDCFNPTRTYTPGQPSIAQWEDVWALMRMNYVVRQFFGRALGANNSANRTNVSNGVLGVLYQEYASVAEMNNRLAANCNAARNAGILVYGIAFQAPAAGRNAIQSCTSVPASTYYFDVTETAKIQDAFRLIATNLSQLKLTQ
ncbi:TadE/TadG family type IV pilus assembly protein [Pseudogemmobacter bohemicus]|uniref:TadE/TadG family type IV pilus assembly protein n=1 Tax=Pseudogemmobacter bohemicus TaxID=2250708 RepID=UPI0013009A4B|nr:VWA domain-containing protein [Pseudogemmobacter bohemicus]